MIESAPRELTQYRLQAAAAQEDRLKPVHQQQLPRTLALNKITITTNPYGARMRPVSGGWGIPFAL